MKILESIEKYEKEIEKELREVISLVDTDELSSETSICRYQESSFGNFLCDSMRDIFGGDFAFFNGGCIRGNR